LGLLINASTTRSLMSPFFSRASMCSILSVSFCSGREGKTGAGDIRRHTGNIRRVFREHLEESGNFRRHSGNIRKHSGNNLVGGWRGSGLDGCVPRASLQNPKMRPHTLQSPRGGPPTRLRRFTFASRR
jgi:hypothetical protein